MKSVVIGDVHGCAAEFEELLDRSDANAPGTRVRLVGDLLTKGPDPAGVVRTIAGLRRNGLDIHSVCGNHDLRLHKALLQVREGLPVDRLARAERETIERLDLRDEMDAALELLAETIDRISTRAGRATVVHAGVRPELGLEGTSPHDLVHLKARDGRRPWWQDYDGRSGLIVVGHKPVGEPVRRFLRGRPIAVNVDTGCAAGGRLTAYVVEEDRFISVASRQVRPSRPAVHVETGLVPASRRIAV